MQMGDAGKDELDPLDLQAHGPLHQGPLAAEHHGTELDQASSQQSIRPSWATNDKGV